MRSGTTIPQARRQGMFYETLVIFQFSPSEVKEDSSGILPSNIMKTPALLASWTSLNVMNVYDVCLSYFKALISLSSLDNIFHCLIYMFVRYFSSYICFYLYLLFKKYILISPHHPVPSHALSLIG